jgi:hypothetical protein
MKTRDVIIRPGDEAIQRHCDIQDYICHITAACISVLSYEAVNAQRLALATSRRDLGSA